MSTRYFFFWCERCPTRVTVETEVPAGTPKGEPGYSFAESEGVSRVQTRMPTADDDGMEPATLCPACGSQLHDLDGLLAVSLVPYHESKDTADEHAAWLERNGEGYP